MALGRKTGGRQKGSRNKATRAKEREIAASGLTPLDYMLSILRSDAAEDKRFEAAKAAAPYVHPRLQAVDHSSKDGTMAPALIIDRASDHPSAPASKAGYGTLLNGH